MSELLCTRCFGNVGLRKEAEKVAGPAILSVCPHCKQSGGRAIDAAAAETLMGRFFCTGSIPPESGGQAHLYAFNQQNHPGDITFATELDDDVRILSDFLGVGLFHYGPPLWRLGYTDHYQKLRNFIEDGQYESSAQRKQLWQSVLDRCQVRTLNPEAEIFKVRKGGKLPPAVPAEFDTSPTLDEVGSRYESDGFRILYGAEDIETCLHESRVTLADWIAVATLTPNRPLRLIDLTRDIDDSAAPTPFERVDIFLERLSFAGKEDYDLCREMAKEILGMALDGFYFTSYFAQAHRNPLRNVALFGFPIAEGKVLLRSVNRVQLTSMAYEYSFGPPNDTGLPIEATEAQAIAARLLEHGNPAEAAKELDKLLARKSAAPR